MEHSKEFEEAIFEPGLRSREELDDEPADWQAEPDPPPLGWGPDPLDEQPERGDWAHVLFWVALLGFVVWACFGR